MNRAERRRQAREGRKRPEEEREDIRRRMMAAEQTMLQGRGALDEIQRRSDSFRNSAFIRQKIADRVERNGITEKDLNESWEDGRQYGFNQAAWPVIRSCFAGVSIALHDEFGFDDEQCYRLICRLNDTITYALSHEELVEETLAKTGIELRLGDVLEPVQRI